jgi:hypothetical protein
VTDSINLLFLEATLSSLALDAELLTTSAGLWAVPVADELLVNSNKLEKDTEGRHISLVTPAGISRDRDSANEVARVLTDKIKLTLSKYVDKVKPSD